MILYQPIKGYCYNSDTHFLYNFICDSLKKYKNVNGELLDIGSGSGILGLLLARDYKKLSLNQCEIQDIFQTYSSINSKCNNIDSFIYKDSFIHCDFKKQFDMCVSNPPFYHSCVIKSENKSLKIARYNDSLPLETFIKQNAKILKNNGKLFFCYDVKQLNDIIYFLQKYKLNLESLQFVHPNKNKNASLVLIYARKNSKSLLSILEPLFVFEGKEFSKNTQEIYKKSSTYSIKAHI